MVQASLIFAFNHVKTAAASKLCLSLVCRPYSAFAGLRLSMKLHQAFAMRHRATLAQSLLSDIQTVHMSTKVLNLQINS